MCLIAKRYRKPDTLHNDDDTHNTIIYINIIINIFLSLLLLLFITIIVCVSAYVRDHERGAPHASDGRSRYAHRLPRTFDARRHGVEKINDNEQYRGRPDNTPLWVPRPCLPVGRVNVLPRPPPPPQLLLSFPVGRTYRGAVHGPHRYARTHWRLAHASQGRVRRYSPPTPPARAAAADERTMVVVGLPATW